MLLSSLSLCYFVFSAISIVSAENGRHLQTNLENDVLLLAYANNPFGISIKLATNSTAMSLEQLDEGAARAKRGVFHLYSMVKCTTGCDPLSYKGYGCFCGFLGSGRPVDGIDRCCKKHDWCYNNAGCPPFFEYLMPYYWQCRRGRPLCAVEHGEYGGRNSCARRLCECDRSLAECLARHPCPRTRALCHSSPWRLVQNAFMLL